MIKGLYKFVFGIIGAIVVTGLIVFVTFSIGHAVTGSWNPAEWKKPDNAASIVSEYNYEFSENVLEGYALD